jgi:hypothetical protein
LRVTLEEIEPPIWREVAVPSDAALRDLHHVLQAAFGWKETHLHLFEVLGERFGPRDPEMQGLHDELRARMAEVLLEAGAVATYVYDLGDEWRHRIDVIAIEPDVAGRPRCLGGARAGPPEDCGGVPGYEKLLEALANPGDPQTEELREWAGRWRPETFSRASADRRIARRFDRRQ